MRSCKLPLPRKRHQSLNKLHRHQRRRLLLLHPRHSLPRRRQRSTRTAVLSIGRMLCALQHIDGWLGILSVIFAENPLQQQRLWSGNHSLSWNVSESSKKRKPGRTSLPALPRLPRDCHRINTSAGTACVLCLSAHVHKAVVPGRLVQKSWTLIWFVLLFAFLGTLTPPWTLRRKRV